MLLEESIQMVYDEFTMTEYDVPRRMRRLLKLVKKNTAWDPDELTSMFPQLALIERHE